ncbi:MAG: hypothetical protein KGL39_15950 [Patescibacteria group bacterium]|nr:hypothetical protein [Patescibacteria group bacterium]
MTFIPCQSCGATFIGTGWGPQYCGPCLDAIREGLRSGGRFGGGVTEKEAASRIYDIIQSTEAHLPEAEREDRWRRFMEATDAVAERHEKRRGKKGKKQ